MIVPLQLKHLAGDLALLPLPFWIVFFCAVTVAGYLFLFALCKSAADADRELDREVWDWMHEDRASDKEFPPTHSGPAEEPGVSCGGTGGRTRGLATGSPFSAAPAGGVFGSTQFSHQTRREILGKILQRI